MTMTGLRTAALLAASLCWISGAAAVDIATVAKIGDQAPGTPPGVTFRSLNDGFHLPVVNGAGEVAFLGALTGPGVTDANDEGLWAGRPGALRLVAREGDPATGTPAGATFGEPFGSRIFGQPLINGAGEVAFGGDLIGPGVTVANDHGTWIGRPGALRLLARAGDPAPGMPAGVVFLGVRVVAFNGAGEAVVESLLVGPSVPPGVSLPGIWAGSSGALRLVAVEGAPAPGAGGAVFDFGGIGVRPSLNGAGEVAFFAALTGSGVTRDNETGIWAGAPGRLRLVARAGARAPGTPAGSTFEIIEGANAAFNGAGEVAFRTLVLERGGSFYDSIWAGRAGRLRLVTREGDPAPGTPVGVTVGGFNSRLTTNGAGAVVFEGALTGRGVNTRNSTGLWVADSDGLRLVVREGARAPGTRAGARFRSPLPRERVAFNGTGEVAFRARLRGRGVTRTNDQGIWTGGAGGLALVVREGNAIEVAPGVFRTVADNGIDVLLGTGNEDGRRSGFSEGGQSTFWASFTDGSEGIFLSPPAAPIAYRMPQRAIDDDWDRIVLPRSFSNPVIIAGPPTSRNRAPGVVRLRRIDGINGHFEGRFQEWRYLDGRHREERSDFLVLQEGRHRQADGSIWEAGTVDVSGNRSWTRQPFTRPFPRPPQVFVTVQTFNGTTAVAARVRNVTRTGFEVSIQEEERDLASGHPLEDVGYLAVFSRRGRGTIAGGVEGTNYRLGRSSVDHRFRRVLGERIKLEEERSLDREIRHARERVSVMTVGQGLFAQQASDRERDTTALRKR